MPYDYSIHSDFLIHWTGKDIDNECDPSWHRSDKSKTCKCVTKRYVNRLKDILMYGLWMTSEYPELPKELFCDLEEKDESKYARTCFTELKLSQSRIHAKQYGRLGIGFKRPFLIQHHARPLIYYGFDKEDCKRDEFLNACCSDIQDKRLLNYFKPMNSGKTKNYDYYAESEWRILYSADRVRPEPSSDQILCLGHIVNPHCQNNSKAYSYIQDLDDDEQGVKKTPDFLIPVNELLSIIIYPSLDVKREAQKEEGENSIPKLIKSINEMRTTEENRPERGNMPIEMDLDACRHF